MIINIFGSTGTIGSKTLFILSKYFKNIKINLLVCNENYNKLLLQIKKYRPKYVYIQNQIKSLKLQKKLKTSDVVILNNHEFKFFLKNQKSDLCILAISGLSSLYYFNYALKNTKNIGLVSKECIVSSGHLFNKIISNKVKIFPLDSEHFSLYDFFLKNTHKNIINKIYITASGGPFLDKKISLFNKITFNEAIKHPKWKMGYKNSIDSSTMANKCLEIIEAKYLFDIPFEKINILIHPESLIHSIVELNNHISSLNYFFNDMFIPIFNFLNTASQNNIQISNKNFLFKKNLKLNFVDVDIKRFPIYKIFLHLNKDNPINIIKFNCANEHAVELFKAKKIRYDQISKIINKCLLIDIDYPVNNIKNIIEFNKLYMEKINASYKKIY